MYPLVEIESVRPGGRLSFSGMAAGARRLRCMRRPSADRLAIVLAAAAAGVFAFDAPQSLRQGQGEPALPILLSVATVALARSQARSPLRSGGRAPVLRRLMAIALAAVLAARFAAPAPDAPIFLGDSAPLVACAFVVEGPDDSLAGSDMIFPSATWHARAPGQVAPGPCPGLLVAYFRPE